MPGRTNSSCSAGQKPSRTSADCFPTPHSSVNGCTSAEVNRSSASTLVGKTNGTPDRPGEPAVPTTPLAEVAVWLRPEDNVAVAARPLAAGLEIAVAGRTLTLASRVGLGHKFALQSISADEPVRKYGQI